MTHDVRNRKPAERTGSQELAHPYPHIAIRSHLHQPFRTPFPGPMRRAILIEGKLQGDRLITPFAHGGMHGDIRLIPIYEQQATSNRDLCIAPVNGFDDADIVLALLAPMLHPNECGMVAFAQVAERQQPVTKRLKLVPAMFRLRIEIAEGIEYDECWRKRLENLLFDKLGQSMTQRRYVFPVI